MKRPALLLTAVLVLLVSPLMADTDFDNGMHWSRQSKGQGESAIQGFNPEESLPDYTPSPAETAYYGGITASGVDMTTPGMSALHSSDVGQTITESILNTPPDSLPSLDAPYIAEGLAIKDKAEKITGGGFDGCVEQSARFTEITTHQCLRDTKIEQYCTRTASLGAEGSSEWIMQTLDYELSELPSQVINGNIVVTVMPPISGDITEATYSWQNNSFRTHFLKMTVSFLGKDVHWRSHDQEINVRFNPFPPSFSAGQSFTSSHPRKTDGATFKAHVQMKLHFVVRVKKDIYKPVVTWTEYCPFSKTEGPRTRSECVEPGGTRTIIAGGQTLSMYQDCWKWQDTYLTQTETEGSCGEYISNKACSVTRSECADSVEGYCVSQRVTYSCERRKEGHGQICGGEFFCTDGSCAQGESGISNMFGQAVSALAAVAAAGQDVADLNGEDIRAFTGKARSCRKMAVGFNNCCKDNGWGQDIGLSACSTDEKALGKAKDKKLTVYVGEYCSEKVLGVCVEKKRGYCVFDSLLSRIVQEQGRQGQLGIGFGKGKSPDCRGITVDELQQLNFDVMNFSDFYIDLENGTTIPEDEALLKKAQEIIDEKMTGIR